MIKGKVLPIFSIIVLGREPKVMTRTTSSFNDYYSMVLNNLHRKLEIKAFLRNKWTTEAQENLNTVLAVWSKAGMGQTAGGAKELWSSSWWCKIALVKTDVCKNDQTFWLLQKSVLTRVLLRHQLFWWFGGKEALNNSIISYWRRCL